MGVYQWLSLQKHHCQWPKGSHQRSPRPDRILELSLPWTCPGPDHRRWLQKGRWVGGMGERNGLADGQE